MLTLALLITQLFVLGIHTWGICEYIRLRHQLWNIKRRIVTMNCDNLIDELLEADSGAVAKEIKRRAGPETTHRAGGEDTGTTDTKYQQHRERLAALAAGGRAQQYLWKALSVDQVDNMDDEEVEKLYGRYEARLGAAMTKTLGAAALQLYTSVASMFLPIPLEEQPRGVTSKTWGWPLRWARGQRRYMRALPSLWHVPCPGDRGTNHAAALPIWTAWCPPYRQLRWKPKFSRHRHRVPGWTPRQSRRRGWREWQRLRQSWLRRRLSQKTPKKLPLGGQALLPEKPNKNACWRSSALRKRPSLRPQRQ